MTDWKEHNGGPQPVGDNVWVEAGCDQSDTDCLPASDFQWNSEESFKWRILNQPLIDAALERGIRLGLEAAARTVCKAEIKASPDEARFAGLAEAADLIRALDPATIAKEADR